MPKQKQIILSRAKCGCKMLSKADPVTLSAIVECKRHREQRKRYKDRCDVDINRRTFLIRGQ